MESRCSSVCALPLTVAKVSSRKKANALFIAKKLDFGRAVQGKTETLLPTERNLFAAACRADDNNDDGNTGWQKISAGV